MTIDSVVMDQDGRRVHEYWVRRDGKLIARCANLNAVTEWCEGHDPEPA